MLREQISESPKPQRERTSRPMPTALLVCRTDNSVCVANTTQGELLRLAQGPELLDADTDTWKTWELATFEDPREQRRSPQEVKSDGSFLVLCGKTFPAGCYNEVCNWGRWRIPYASYCKVHQATQQKIVSFTKNNPKKEGRNLPQRTQSAQRDEYKAAGRLDVESSIG